MQTKICEYCNKEFIPNDRTLNRQRFCSTKCQQRYLYQHPKGPICICRYCSKEFISKVTAKGMYCSRLCADKDVIIRPVKPNPICKICGKEFERRLTASYCSDDCIREQARRRDFSYQIKNHQVKTIICKECSKELKIEYGIKNTSFCSIKCSLKYGRRVSKALRRARVKGLRYESINPIEIFIRDNWRCKVCGVKTPKRLRGTLEDNAPELDHIIPLSKDGTHTQDNVQCLCRKCNGNKSDKIKLQLQFA